MENLKRSNNKLEGGSRTSSHRILNRLLGKFKNMVDNFSNERMPELAEFEPEISKTEPTRLPKTPAKDDPETHRNPTLQLETTLTSADNSNTVPEDTTHHHPPPDWRYCGQVLSPDELPAFCDQLHQLVEVVRYIQGYAKVTGEYPKALELRVDNEARELYALMAEANLARDAISRARAQRAALRKERKETIQILRALREEEILDMESEIRTADPRLYRDWIRARDSASRDDLDDLAAKLQFRLNAIHHLETLITWRRTRLQSQASVLPIIARPATSMNIQGPATSHPTLQTTPRIRTTFRKHGTAFKRHRKEPSRPAPIILEPNPDNSISRFTPTTSYDETNASNSFDLITRTDVPINWLPPLAPDSDTGVNVGGLDALIPTPPPFPAFRFGTDLFSQLERPENMQPRRDENRNIDVILVSLDGSENEDN